MQTFNKMKATLVLLAAVLVAGFAFAEAGKKLTTLWEEGKVFTEWDTIELTGNDVKQGDRLVVTYTAAGSAAQDSRAEAPLRNIDKEGQIRLFVDDSTTPLIDDEVTGEGTVDYTFTAAVAATQKLIISARNLTITKVELETEEEVEPVEPLAINNPSFEADGEKATSNGALELTGWTFSGVGTQYNNTELRPANSASTTSQFGTSDPKDGEYFLFFRQGWNGGGNAIKVTSEALDVPAGKYMLSVAYKQHYSHDGTPTTNTFVGLSLVNGETTLAQGQSPAATGVQGANADATYFNVTDWSVLEVPVELAADANGSQIVITLNAGGQRRSDFCIDDVKLVPVSELDIALAALQAAIEAAQAQAATYAVGEGLFYYAASEIEPLTQAIAAAQAAYDAAASAEAVNAAAETLNAFLASFAPEMTPPDESKPYNVTNATADGNLCIADGKVTVAHDATVFFTAVEGGYVLSNEAGEYISKTADNNWTLATTTEQASAYVVTIVPVEGGYTIRGVKGLFGLDDATEGSTVYANKAQSNHGLWTISEAYVAPKTDYTDQIVNANLTATDGWNTEGTKGLDGSGIVKCSSGSSFDFKQTIVNLPAGQYKLTAQAAYRFGSSEQIEYDAIQAGTATKLATLYATVGEKTTSQPVMNRYDGASETDFAAGSGSVQVNNLWVPNSSAAVQTWFQAGQYVNEVVFNLAEDGDVTIGIVKTESPDAGDYTVIGPWTLTRLGDAQEEQQAVKDITVSHERVVGLGYGATTATIDLEAAKAHLGVEAIEYNMVRIENPDGTLISDYAPFDGWFSTAGVATTWADLNAEGAVQPGICVKLFQAVENNGQFEICDMNGADVLGQTYTVRWQLVSGEKAVRYAVNVTFVEAPQVTPDIIATIDVAATLKPATAYEGATATFDAANVASRLGLNSLGEATAYIVNVTTGEFVLNSTDGWRNAQGDAAAWGSGAGQVCVKINDPASGTIDYLAAIDETYQEGDTYTAKWGFVNAANKAVVLNINITFTEGSSPDAISSVEGQAENGAIYNLRGQRVQQPVKGLYIVGGKKVMKR